MPTILITGVSTGIGKAAAKRFASAGWTVIGTVRDPDRAERRSRAWSLRRSTLRWQALLRRWLQRVLERSGCPDAILNNAGMLQFGPLECYAAEELELLYRVNVFGQLELIRPFLPAMRERGSGVIANVTSLGGLLVFPFFAAYNSTKWALEGISEGLWHELKPFGDPGEGDRARLRGDRDLGQGPAGCGRADRWRRRPIGPTWRRCAASRHPSRRRTTPEAAAEEVFSAVTDESDRLALPDRRLRAADLARAPAAWRQARSCASSTSAGWGPKASGACVGQG